MESDPQVLVALIVGGIGNTIPAVAATPTVQRIVEDPHTLPVLVSSATGGTRTVPAEPIFQTCDSIVEDYGVDGAVLDAIASISVSRPTSQFVAVALEIDVSKQVAVLTISDSGRVGPDLIAYLNGLWRLMGIMSNRCEQLRRADDLAAATHARPPITTAAAIEPWRTEFIKRVYLYCNPKDFQLIQTRWESLRAVSRALWNLKKHSDDEIQNGQLTDSVYALLPMYSFLQNITYGQMTDEMWGDLICLMDGTVADLETILKDPSRFQKWINVHRGELLLDPRVPVSSY